MCYFQIHLLFDLNCGQRDYHEQWWMEAENVALKPAGNKDGIRSSDFERLLHSTDRILPEVIWVWQHKKNRNVCDLFTSASSWQACKRLLRLKIILTVNVKFNLWYIYLYLICFVTNLFNPLIMFTFVFIFLSKPVSFI